MRHLGIDYGTKKIGLALSDEAGTMGFPNSIITNDGKALAHLTELVRKESVGRIVMGESRSFSGMENPVAREAREFAKSLEEETNVEVVLEPEILTTQEAKRDFEGVHVAKSGHVDASAAALILTSYLSRDHE